MVEQLIRDSLGAVLTPDERLTIELRGSPGSDGWEPDVELIGDNRDDITALIVLEPALAAGFAAQPGIQAASIPELAARPDILAEVTRHVQSVNKRLSAAEQILAFRILPAEWTVEGEELTPTLKIRRAAIEHKHAEEIQAMYAYERSSSCHSCS